MDDKAARWGWHLAWEVRQLCCLGVRLEELRRAGKIVLADPVEAATLEAFVLHVRSLIDFCWLSENDDAREARRQVTPTGSKIIKKTSQAGCSPSTTSIVRPIGRPAQ